MKYLPMTNVMKSTKLNFDWILMRVINSGDEELHFSNIIPQNLINSLL